jgi:hypothetical protein
LLPHHYTKAIRFNNSKAGSASTSAANQLIQKTTDHVHIGQTPEATIIRVKRHLPAEDVPKLPKGRYQIISLWGPIYHEAYN